MNQDTEDSYYMGTAALSGKQFKANEVIMIEIFLALLFLLVCGIADRNHEVTAQQIERVFTGYKTGSVKAQVKGAWVNRINSTFTGGQCSRP